MSIKVRVVNQYLLICRPIVIVNKSIYYFWNNTLLVQNSSKAMSFVSDELAKSVLHSDSKYEGCK